MDKNKEEILEKLRNVKETATADLNKEEGNETLVIQNVIYYGKVTLTGKDGEDKEFELYTIEEYDYQTEKTRQRIYLDGQEADMGELIRDYESIDPIKDIINKAKEKAIEREIENSKDKKEPKQTIYSLNELELEEKREKEEQKDLKDKIKGNERSEEETSENNKIAGTKGAINLDMMVQGETLRKILGLSENDISITPVSREKLLELDPEGQYNNREGFIVTDANGNQRPLKDDVLIPDAQEGNGSFDKDINIEEDGSLSYESNLSSYKIKNRPNLYLSISYGEGTSSRETKISHRSGRKGDNEVEFTLLRKEQDSKFDENSYARKLRMEKDGIEKSEIINEKQENYKEIGYENERIENIDNNEKNNTYPYITEEQLEELAENTGENKDKLKERFEREAEKDPKKNPDKIIEEIEEDYERLNNHDHKI